MRAWCLVLLLAGKWSFAQENFSVSLEQVNINGSPAIHSFAFAQLDGKWIFIGGRVNGLHGFEPPFAFPSSGINDRIYVVDPDGNQTWSASIAGLPDSIREPLTSSNMQFHQRDTMLYVIGGYGWKNSVSDFITFPTLTAIRLRTLVQRVTSNQLVELSLFRQLTDSSMAITGGNLEQLDSTHYLVFGHRFDGRYSVNDTSGFFVQQYSYQIRKFTIEDDGSNLSVKNYQALTDTANFRRRDFNLVPQIFPDRSQGLTAFTGVFRPGLNLPWLNTVDITASSCQVINGFDQNLSQYQCAVLPLYDSVYNRMHTVFFGGMGMYVMDFSTQKLQVDSLIPFVNTISRVTRDSAGQLQEYCLPVSMPALLGTNAVFIPDPQAKMFVPGIVDLNRVTGKERVGYIMGGIESPQPHISDSDPSVSGPSSYIFEVYVEKIPTGAGRDLLFQNYILDFLVYVSGTSLSISFDSQKEGSANVEIFDARGARLAIVFQGKVEKGMRKFTRDITGWAAGVYFCRTTINGVSKTATFSVGHRRR